jgi:CubicO group peptidase (beta-lactamase class C family)
MWRAAASRAAMLGTTFLIAVLSMAPAPTKAQLAAAAEYSAEHSGRTYLVMHRGMIIAEEYPAGGSATRATELASGTKSFTGLMYLCAQEDGLLTLDEYASKTLPEWRGDSRSKITLRQLLSLSSGIPGGESALGGGRVPNYSEAIEAKPNAAPGARFQYGPYPFQILGEIMKRKLAPKGETVLGYMERRIFKPMGISHGFWRKDSEGNPHLPSGAFFTAREWAKFGESIRGGAKVCLKSTSLDPLFKGSKANPSYGLTWWLPAEGLQMQRRAEMPWSAKLPRDVYMAAGAGGQRLYVIPSRELVVVRQAPVLSDRSYNDRDFLLHLLADGKP